MQVAESVTSAWKARLSLEFRTANEKTILGRKCHDGPLVVQKPLYPEGEAVCHAIMVHPPGGIAGGDELRIEARVGAGAAALLTTPGAAKWYRSGGPRATQDIALDVRGTLEWLPQESIVFDGALAASSLEADLAAGASLIGWDIVCLGRTGSGERFTRGSYRTRIAIRREGRPVWLEQGQIDGGSPLLASPAGLGGSPVFGTLFACAPGLARERIGALREVEPASGRGAATLLPGILLARYLGDSSEAARRYFVELWRRLRPSLAGREAHEPRIWRT
jgi:urease accessory protein